jgi:hypothetical protein
MMVVTNSILRREPVSESESPKVLAKISANMRVDGATFNEASLLKQGYRVVKSTPVESIPGVATCEIEILDTPEGRQAIELMKTQKIPAGVSVSFSYEK